MDAFVEPLYHQVKDLIVEVTQVRPDKVHPQAKIEDDLGTTGDDAVELMEKFAERFQVDMTGFDFSVHFGPEGGGCLVLLLLFPFWLGKQSDEDYRNFQPVTVGHLVQVAQRGAWFDPPPRAHRTSNR
jgi:acyl carrier protein